MSEPNNARKTSENKRKLDDPIEDDQVESKKNARVALSKSTPFSVGDMMSHLGVAIDANADLMGELHQKIEEIEKKYKDDIFVVKYNIRKLKAEKEQLRKAKLNEEETARDKVFAENRRFQVVNPDVAEELLTILGEQFEYFYACAECDDTKNLASSLLRVLNNGETYREFGIDGSERRAFKQFVMENIDIVRANAIVPAKGQMRSDGKKIKFRTDGVVMVTGYPNARCSIDYNWNEFLEEYGIQPNKDTLKWDNPKGWATVNFEFDVWVVKMKDGKE